MKRVIIKNLLGQEIFGAIIEDPADWVASCVASEAWGKPETYTVEVEDVTSSWALGIALENRRKEYPSAEEFLNAYFDGGETALNALQAKRLEVKAKYPKP
jgi:hypothetical protein